MSKRDAHIQESDRSFRELLAELFTNRDNPAKRKELLKELDRIGAGLEAGAIASIPNHYQCKICGKEKESGDEFTLMILSIMKKEPDTSTRWLHEGLPQDGVEWKICPNCAAKVDGLDK